MSTRIAPIILAIAVVLSACGGGTAGGTDTTAAAETTVTGSDTTGAGTTVPTTTPTDSTSPENANPDEVVLTLTDTGGFVPVEWLATNGPRFVLAADGTLYAQDPAATGYPDNPVQPYVVVDASASLSEIQSLIDSMGLADIDDEENLDAADVIADASTTTVTYTDPDGVDHTYSVYALGIAGGPGEDPPVIDDPKAEDLFELTELLADVAATSESTPYQPEQWQVYLQTVGEALEGETRPWPLETAPDDFDDVGWLLPCLTVDSEPGADAALTGAPAMTAWEAEGGAWHLLTRPLLPGETGCQPPT